ncbi:hypothetical protein ACRCLC_19465, partial [Acinetobacter baumannii]|uniref:hypothetical protein n=1 Tax=Acinetobacter baumannii TaxID=470 RepID=UPI003D6AE481
INPISFVNLQYLFKKYTPTFLPGDRIYVNPDIQTISLWASKSGNPDFESASVFNPSFPYRFAPGVIVI